MNTAKLTPRETEVVQGVAEGLTNRQIAKRLGLTSAGTIHNYRMNVYRKLGLNSGTALILWAMKRQIVMTRPLAKRKNGRPGRRRTA